MSPAQQLYRSIGVRHQEAQTVWLFFLHNFFLGIGTILVYVSANVILLENHPETSLPIAYVASAVGMMLVGKLYAYYEHHLALRTLAVRVLWAVIVLTFVLAILVVVGYSVWAAVAIMVGFRMIYLLTNLEFWGVSAVVFDVRQSKRLFSVISSGDMPAKALGAVLAVLIHHHTEMFLLLFVAFGSFLAAIYILNRTYRSHDIHTPHGSGRVRAAVQPRIVEQLFGNSSLITSMCLSLVAIASVAAGVEYAFFINVKYKIHSTYSLLQYVGGVLTLTYLVAMGVKLLLSRQALDRMGIQRSLQLLPVAALVGVLIFAGLWLSGVGESTWLFYYCALYLTFEVLRRALFDPVFLVLFQPLTTHQRLKGHTLAKGFYEPLGMALTGALIYSFHAFPSLNEWLPFVWMGLGTGAALVLLRHTYLQYLNELKSALGRRFLETTDLAAPDEALGLITTNLQSPKAEEVIGAIDWLKAHHPATLKMQLVPLLQHPDARVRLATLYTVTRSGATFNASRSQAAAIHQLAVTDADPAIREGAARLFSELPNRDPQQTAQLIQHSDEAVRKGALLGGLTASQPEAAAEQSLRQLMQATDPASQISALEIIHSLKRTKYLDFVQTSLQSDDPGIVHAAIRAAGSGVDPQLTPHLVELLTDKTYWRVAARSLTSLGDAVLPFLADAVESVDNRTSLRARRIAAICGKLDIPESHQLLVRLVQQPHLSVRMAALHALNNAETTAVDEQVFESVLNEELHLAQRLLHGSLHKSDKELVHCIAYENSLLLQRVFYLLMHLYDAEVIANVRTGIEHASRERRANALEMLENLIPRSVYLCLQALVDNLPTAERVRLMDAQLGPFHAEESLLAYILHQGETTFSDWTISVALRGWMPRSAATAHLLNDYLHHPVQLLSSSAAGTLQTIWEKHPDWQPRLQAEHATLSTAPMKTLQATAHISDFERVIVLKNTRLFADTPENILASIAPIMKEVTYSEGVTIFQKGEIGNCMFLIYSGAVDIYDRQKKLAQFGKGDVFGELALLDAEPRSASAVVASDVLLFRIDHEDFYDLMEERGEVLRNVIRILCQRIRYQNDQLQAASTSPHTD